MPTRGHFLGVVSRVNRKFFNSVNSQRVRFRLRFRDITLSFVALSERGKQGCNARTSRNGPPQTYCIVRGGTDFNSFEDAQDYCNTFFMPILSMTSTPMYRICRLIKLFGIKDGRLWVEDTLHQPDTLGWEDCYFRAENETTPAVNCKSCNVSVICVEHAIYSNDSRCDTRAEGDNDVEYCLENDKVNASEASKRCAEHSSMLGDTQKKDQSFGSLYSLSSFNQESWVDLKKEDLSELSGVFSVNFSEIDWTLSCTTVWLNAVVPWFFVRNCSDFYPVLCEASNSSKDEGVSYYSHDYIRDCGDHNWVYCFSGFRTFNKTTASEYCANYTFSLLSGKALRTLLFVRVYFLTPFQVDTVVWDSNSMSNRQSNSNTCYAIDIPAGLRVTEYNCSAKLRYA
ncbi:hypothetical protein MTO96_033236, partial [Rhipicephalus appendiculatus]